MQRRLRQSHLRNNPRKIRRRIRRKKSLNLLQLRKKRKKKLRKN